MKCKYCGYESPDDMIYCEYCGRQLRVVPQPIDNRFKNAIIVLTVTALAQAAALVIIIMSRI